MCACGTERAQLRLEGDEDVLCVRFSVLCANEKPWTIPPLKDIQFSAGEKKNSFSPNGRLSETSVVKL